LIQVNDAGAPAWELSSSLTRSQRRIMNHHHRKTLHALFAHPISANIDFKKVLHLLEEIGAEVGNKSGNRVGVKLNGHSVAFPHAHHDLPKDEVAQVRKFLEACGVTPETYPL
jgi:hypothetical protein